MILIGRNANADISSFRSRWLPTIPKIHDNHNVGQHSAKPVFFIFCAIASIAPAYAEDVKIFGDWAVGCDNARTCRATSLPIEEGPDERIGDGTLALSVDRDGAVHGPPKVELAFIIEMSRRDYKRVRWISVDNQKLDIRLSSGNGVYDLDVTASNKLIVAMRGKLALELLDNKENTLAIASLRGLSDALDFMDQRQFLSGTVAALARPGNKAVNAYTVPPMLPPVTIKVAPKPVAAPRKVDAAKVDELHATSPCLSHPFDSREGDPQYVRLDERHTLIILPLQCGGYVPVSAMFVIDERGTVVSPRFWRPGFGENRYESGLPNVRWDERARTLVSFAQARVSSDCGEISKYVWAKDMFVLSYSASMPVCRGSRDFITTYRADVRLLNTVAGRQQEAHR
jgi:hypothetical protein